MHIGSNIRNFLIEQNYAIQIFGDNIHVFKFIDIERLTDTDIIIQLDDFKLKIKGNYFCVKKLEKNEIQIQGEILEMSFIR